jgi:hypothetical protein
METLDGMTQKRWSALTPAQRETLRAPAYPAQLAPYLGDRVEVVTHYGETRRFWVGRSTGWRPCYLEVKTSRSTGGMSADGAGYKSIRVIRRGPRR